MRAWVLGIAGGALALAGSVGAAETPMRHTPSDQPVQPPQVREAPAIPSSELSAGERLRAVLGRPADCPPGQATKPRETGV